MSASKKQLFAYFRMAIVTGLTEPAAAVNWADRLLVMEPEADYDLVRLSLSASQSLSQIAWLLNDMQCDPRDVLPYYLVLARAGLLLERDGSRGVEILQGILLLEAEYYLPKEIRLELGLLNGGLAMLRLGETDHHSVAAALENFLAGYRAYRELLPEGSINGFENA